jgi:predicted nucleotidyltransferase
MLTGVQADSIRHLAQHAPGLRLLALHGSRSRDDARVDSDWDFGYLAGDGFDPDALLAGLAEVLHADRIDLADLTRASGQLRFRVAREGVVIYARDDAEWERFWMEAVSFWCDAGPVLRAAYDGALQDLGR